ncbi:unnamed protein product [Calypogeia fissa]
MDVIEAKEARQDPKLQLAQHLFLLRKASPSRDAAVLLHDAVFKAVCADNMAGLYQSFWPEMGWESTFDVSKLEELNTKNAEEFTKLDEK